MNSAGVYGVQGSSRRTHEEDIYEDLCYVTLRVGPSSPQATVWPTVPAEKRDYCIKELVETEKNYIEALNMIVRHFLRPLKSVMTQNDRRTVFLHVKELSEIHTEFHSELFKSCTSSQHRISNCFLHWKDKFVLYGEYCANLPKAQSLIDEICTRNEIVNQSVIRCQMEANDGKFKLRDLLSLPMQRVLKYHLLLNELIKCSESHDDLSGLKKAYESMVDLGQYINEVKRDSETLQIIGDIQQSITDLDMPENTDLKDYGRLLKDGELKLKSQDDTKQKSRYIFVFDKVMLMCKSIRGEHYSYKEALILADYKVEDLVTTNSASKLIHKDKFGHSWQLVHRQETISYTFFAKTEEIKQKWIEALKKALDNVCPNSNGISDHTFTMHTFDKATTCADCDKLLRGIFFQGYKCTVCSLAVHKNCIPTVRSCGAPNLPPRPPIPSSPSLISTYSGDEDVGNSWNDLRRAQASGLSTPLEQKLRTLFSFEGDATAGQISFGANEVLILMNKQSTIEDEEQAWWEGRVQKTGEEGLFPSNLVEELDVIRTSYEESAFSFPVSSEGRLNKSDSSVSLNLEEYQWFAGSMDRDNAQSLLDRLPNGTFLVRISPNQRGNYAMSLNYNGHVKHMRVCLSEDHFYLSTSKYFKTIVELVRWYEEHSLAESFNGLNLMLTSPYKRALAAMKPISHAVAMYSFTANAANLLNLRKGETVAVLSKAGEERGWWKGQIDTRIGYFPLAYVKEVAAGSDSPSDTEMPPDSDHDKENRVADPDTVVL